MEKDFWKNFENFHKRDYGKILKTHAWKISEIFPQILHFYYYY